MMTDLEPVSQENQKSWGDGPFLHSTLVSACWHSWAQCYFITRAGAQIEAACLYSHTEYGNTHPWTGALVATGSFPFLQLQAVEPTWTWKKFFCFVTFLLLSAHVCSGGVPAILPTPRKQHCCVVHSVGCCRAWWGLESIRSVKVPMLLGTVATVLLSDASAFLTRQITGWKSQEPWGRIERVASIIKEHWVQWKRWPGALPCH